MLRNLYTIVGNIKNAANFMKNNMSLLDTLQMQKTLNNIATCHNFIRGIKQSASYDYVWGVFAAPPQNQQELNQLPAYPETSLTERHVQGIKMDFMKLTQTI